MYARWAAGRRACSPDEGGNQRSSEAIRGHQRPSEAIRGHQLTFWTSMPAFLPSFIAASLSPSRAGVMHSSSMPSKQSP